MVFVRFCKSWFLIGLTFLSFFVLADDQLHRSDIQKIMEQILDQHVDKKSVSSEILKNSFSIYIEQFDPEGIYLLQSEAEPYFEMSDQEAASIEKQYLQGDYTAYEKLNSLIQNAIARARYYRSQIELNPRLHTANINQPPRIFKRGDLSRYPVNEAELQNKIQNQISDYFHEEIRRYGEKGILGYEAQAIALFERHMRSWEDPYLYQLDNGALMNDEEQENLFTLHVLKAIAKSLDAHTAFFDANEAYDLRVRLEKGFDGIGIVFQESPRGIVVSHLTEGGPALKQGEVKIGDLLMEINGTSIQSLSFDKVLGLLRGEKDEPVRLSFKRFNKNGAEQNLRVTIHRDNILLNDGRVDVSYEQFGSGIIGRITLHSFYQNDQGITSEKDVRDAIKKLDQHGNLRGLILDLRENSGGFLSQAVKVVGLFITNGVVVISKYANGDQKIYRDTDSSRLEYKGPLIVLTSKATASAAEIVAQALQDYGVAIVVGDEQTYGKGTIQSQTVTDKKGGSYFKVTVGEYYTVSGKTPQLHGVAADVVVPGPFSQAQLGEEYLEHPIAKSETINPFYKDPLHDIDPDIRPWYMHYYVPTLQTKETQWRDLLPELKKNSAYRIEHNKNYQLFLKRLNHAFAPSPPQESMEMEKGKGDNFGTTDVQLTEALNILKDMIYLQSKARQKEYMVGSER